MEEKVSNLISILLDPTARDDERDDAAMDLGQFDSEECLNALLFVASNPNEDWIILDSCGTSIAMIILKKYENIDIKFIKNLTTTSQESFFSCIKEENYDLFIKLQNQK